MHVLFLQMQIIIFLKTAKNAKLETNRFIDNGQFWWKWIMVCLFFAFYILKTKVKYLQDKYSFFLKDCDITK